MSEKHKAYVLIVMVAIAALVAYVRFFRDSAPSMDTPPPAESKAQAAGPVEWQRHGSESLSGNRAATLQPVEQIRNLFAPVGPLPNLPNTHDPESIVQTNEALTLNGTVIGGDTAMAIINNRFIRQGQMVGGFQVEKITHDRVYLLSGDHRKVLDVMPHEKEGQ